MWRGSESRCFLIAASIAQIDRLSSRRRFRSHLLFGAVVLVVPLCFWYGDLYLVQALMAVGFVWLDYSVLVPSALDRGTPSGERLPSRSGRAAEGVRHRCTSPRR